SDRSLAGKVHPSAARLRASMGEIDLREGRIDDARGLLKQSADEEKSGSVLLSLARIDWRDGQTQPALGHLTDALSAPDVGHDPALRGEILLLMSDVARDKGDVAAADTPPPTRGPARAPPPPRPATVTRWRRRSSSRSGAPSFAAISPRRATASSAPSAPTSTPTTSCTSRSGCASSSARGG